MICLVADLSDLKAPPTVPPSAPSSKPSSIAAAAPSPPSSCRTARCGTATPSSSATPSESSRHVRRSRPRHRRSRSLHPGRNPRPRRHARCGRPFLVVADRDKAKGIAQYRKLKEREAQLAKSFARLPRRPGRADQASRRQGTPPHPQGRRAGLRGGAGRLAAEDVDRKSACQGHPLRRRRHHRDRHPARLGLRRHRHRLQRAPRAQGRTICRAGRRRDPPALHHLRAAGRDAQSHARPAGADLQRDTWAGPKSPTSSAFPRSAPSPAAASPTASSAATPKFASCATARRSTKASSRRSSASRTTSGSQQRHGMRHRHLELHDIKVGDTVETFVTEKIAAELTAS